MTNGHSPTRQHLGIGTYHPGTPDGDGLIAVLRRHATLPLTSRELRDDLRPLVTRAVEQEATVEHLLVALKRAWAELPEVRAPQADRLETSRRLERAVTALIEVYFEP